MARQLEIIARCDEVWLVGGRVSSGMAAERDVAKIAVDLTRFGEEPDPMARSWGKNLQLAVQLQIERSARQLMVY